MKTWYEKYYGVPPPVKKLNKLPEVLQDEEKQEKKQLKESAWYRAQYDYMEYIRNKKLL